MSAPMTHLGIALAGLVRRRRAQVALAVLALLCLVALASEPLRARAHVTGAVLLPPSSAHWLGTDALGRDVLVRVLVGTQTAVLASLGAIGISVVLGSLLGVLAGGSSRYGRRLDRLVEMVDTFPSILVVALLRAAEDTPSVLSVAVGVGIVKSAEIARIVRVEGLRLSTRDYVEASRAMGASRVGAVRRHVLPHLLGPVLVSASLGIAAVTLLETAVSFLGLGEPARSPSWGELLAQAAEHPAQRGLVWGPAAMIALTVGAALLLSDAARDAFSPRRARLR